MFHGPRFKDALEMSYDIGYNLIVKLRTCGYYGHYFLQIFYDIYVENVYARYAHIIPVCNRKLVVNTLYSEAGIHFNTSLVWILISLFLSQTIEEHTVSQKHVYVRFNLADHWCYTVILSHWRLSKKEQNFFRTDSFVIVQDTLI